jgi:hypothetical protein
MLDYVDRKEVIRTLERSGVLPGFAKYLIENYPAADVRPVVRCGECRFRICNNKCGLDDESRRDFDDDDFCSQGEREEAEKA